MGASDHSWSCLLRQPRNCSLGRSLTFQDFQTCGANKVEVDAEVCDCKLSAQRKNELSQCWTFTSNIWFCCTDAQLSVNRYYISGAVLEKNLSNNKPILAWGFDKLVAATKQNIHSTYSHVLGRMGGGWGGDYPLILSILSRFNRRLRCWPADTVTSQLLIGRPLERTKQVLNVWTD